MEMNNIDKPYFFDTVRMSLFGGRLSQKQVVGMEAIIDKADLSNKQLAYVMATVCHETAKTFEPIEEYGKGRGKRYGRKEKMSGAKYTTPDKIYFGRGFVQLTWFENYEKFQKLLGIPLLANPDLALDLNNSVDILLLGMERGLFTGRKLSDYINLSKKDYRNARRIVNGLDRADLIAGYAVKFEKAIRCY